MSYATKDYLDEIARPNSVYGSGVPDRVAAFQAAAVRPAGEPKLHPAEAQVREQYAAHLDDQANTPGLERDTAGAMRGKARQIRDAMPILDFRRAMAVLNDSVDDGPSTGAERIEYQAGVRAAVENLKDQNPYPPDFEHAVDAALARGVSPDDVDLYAVTGIPDPGAEKSAVRELTSAEIYVRAAKSLPGKPVVKAAAPPVTRPVNLGLSADINVAGFTGNLSKAQREAIESAGVEFSKTLAGVLSVDRDAMLAEAVKCERLAETVQERDLQAFYRGRAAELRKELEI